jgi:hypothetical protein
MQQSMAEKDALYQLEDSMSKVSQYLCRLFSKDSI